MNRIAGGGAALDPFIPRFDVRERFAIEVAAPAERVLATAIGFDLQSPRAIRAIFRAREWIMGSSTMPRREPTGLLDELRGLGWGVLEEVPGRLVVCGAWCEPWQADVRFHAIAPGEFAAYAEPGRVKIAWTLEVEPLAAARCRFAHETRVVATDEPARRRFRRYWRWARFGIVSIRLLLMPAVRRAAERTWRRGAASAP